MDIAKYLEDSGFKPLPGGLKTSARVTAEELDELEDLVVHGLHPTSHSGLVQVLRWVSNKANTTWNPTYHLADSRFLNQEFDALHREILEDASSNPVDVVVSALWLHQRLVDVPVGRLPADTHEVAQRALSRALVGHPVMLTPNLLIPCGDLVGLADSRMSFGIGAVVAYHSRTALPCAAQGFTQDELARFATHPSVRRAITWPTMSSRFDPDDEERYTPLEAALKVEPEVSGANRTAYLASALELSAASMTTSGEPIIRPHWDKIGKDATPFEHAARVIWDFAVFGAEDTEAQGLGLDQLLAALRAHSLKQPEPTGASQFDPSAKDATPVSILSARAADGGNLMLHVLAASIDRGLFNDSELTQRSYNAPGQVAAGVAGIARLVVKLGLLPNAAAAAAWLRDAAYGPDRRKTTSVLAPLVDETHAIAFLDGLLALDRNVDLRSDGQLHPPETTDARLNRRFDTRTSRVWLTALAAVRTRETMQRTLEGTSPVAATHPSRRRSL